MLTHSFEDLAQTFRVLGESNYKLHQLLPVDRADILLEFIAHRVDDKRFIRLLSKWLKAGVLEEDGEIAYPEEGTPQGGLCKALHKPPYVKLSIMQSNQRELFVYGDFGQFTLHNMV